MATTDVMAFLCGRVPQPIESLKNLSNMRVPDVAKFRIYADVPKKDPLQKLLTGSPELKQLHAAIARQEVVVEELEKLIVELDKKPQRKSERQFRIGSRPSRRRLRFSLQKRHAWGAT